jgi:DNA repair protein RadC
MQHRETYLNAGPTSLGDPEILALVLGTGTVGESAVDVARALLDHVDGAGGLLRVEPQELARIRGIGNARALRIHAALELARRALATPRPRRRIRNARDAHDVLAPGLVGRVDEELHALYLDARSRSIRLKQLTRGSQAFTIVDPRQVFRVAVQCGANAVILAHNHPSDDPTPSPQDLDVTDRVARAGRMLGIPLVDHLVVARGDWVSLAEQGRIPRSTATPVDWIA